MEYEQRPIIGVTANWFPPEPRAHYNGKGLHVFDHQMVDAIVCAGGTPYLLPNRLDTIAAICPMLHGLLLSGGADVAPGTYGAEPSKWPGQPERDAVELAWLNAAAAAQIPVLGICRGIQMINVAYGGSLIEDLPTVRPSETTHRDGALYDRCEHTMTVEASSRLADWLGTDRLTVNSVHHQGLRAIGRGLRVVASAPDGLVEGIESDDGRVVAVQWHPEWDGRAEQQRLLESFVQACRRGDSE